MVGGGSFFATFMGVAKVICQDRSSILISRVLYVPDLGVNLLSCRRLCDISLSIVFDTKKGISRLNTVIKRLLELICSMNFTKCHELQKV